MLGDWTYMSHPAIRDNRKLEHKITPVTPLKGLMQLSGSHGLTIQYEKGCGFLCSTKDLDQHGIDGHSSLETLILPEVQPLDPDAVLAACLDADVLVACVGDFLAQNGEFRDRGNLDLSGDQQALLELLKSTGKPLVVVLVSGKPLTVPWVSENADAVVQLFNGGQTTGLALAKALTGETNTFGKLPISFAYHASQLPVYHNHYPGWHGGQYVDIPATPLYAFGYGLSYTAYQYGAPQLTRENGEIMVSVDVQNTGCVDGTEIVQLYAHRPAGVNA